MTESADYDDTPIPQYDIDEDAERDSLLPYFSPEDGRAEWSM
jgi:hypothetical protein